MKKILLLNPPGRDIYIRDYYCSKTTQADYLIPPVDLLFASARLYGKYEIEVIDAIAENLGVEACLKRCKEFSPDVVVSLAGAVSWAEDIRFFKELKMQFENKVYLIVSGDIFMDEVEKRFKECPEIDAVIFDFMNEDVARLAEKEFSKTEFVAFRDSSDGSVKIHKQPSTPSNIEYSPGVGIPRHEFFINKRYRHPFAHGRRFATLLTEFGCPYKCSFCIIGTLRYRKRPIEEIISEIRHIKSLRVDEIFVATQTFGASRSYALQLCEKIRQERVGWFTFSRVDVVDEEMLYAMKNAGCHTIIFGVESGSEKILAHYRKGYDKKMIKNILGLCRRIGIETVGTFILGLPEDDRGTLSETLSFIKELPLDYASFNVAVPRHGTELRSEAVSSRLIDGESFNVMDQSRGEVSIGTRNLTPEEVLNFRRKMVRAFYLSPGYLWRRIVRVRSIMDFFSQIKQAISLLRRTGF